MSAGAEPSSVVPPPSALHRWARLATLALLVLGGIAGLLLVAWSIYVRTGNLDAIRGANVMNGLKLAAKLNTAYLGAIGVGAIAALGLAYAIRDHQRWAYLAAAASSALGIVAVQYALKIVTKLEDPRFVKKSPWVKAASSVTLVATIFFAVLIVAAMTAFVSRYQLKRDPR